LFSLLFDIVAHDNNTTPQHKCYIVATNDKDLRRRLRKVPGVPIMYVTKKKYSIERLPDAYGAPK
jgi:U3 small nucleolar RNA-associated protein 24